MHIDAKEIAARLISKLEEHTASYNDKILDELQKLIEIAINEAYRAGKLSVEGSTLPEPMEVP